MPTALAMITTISNTMASFTEAKRRNTLLRCHPGRLPPLAAALTATAGAAAADGGGKEEVGGIMNERRGK